PKPRGTVIEDFRRGVHAYPQLDRTVFKLQDATGDPVVMGHCRFATRPMKTRAFEATTAKRARSRAVAAPRGQTGQRRFRVLPQYVAISLPPQRLRPRRQQARPMLEF